MFKLPRRKDFSLKYWYMIYIMQFFSNLFKITKLNHWTKLYLS